MDRVWGREENESERDGEEIDVVTVDVVPHSPFFLYIFFGGS